MCCFSGHVESVDNTRIFVRAGLHGSQYLAYQMRIEASKPVAMILPVPTPANSAENAVRFIDLSKMPDFFEFLSNAYPRRAPDLMTNGISRSGPRTLEVVQVGSFVASFVPKIKDFSRLAPEFRLPEHVWASLPMHQTFGFVVFQLKPGHHEVHPMAFEFPRRDPHKLFFPTVHIHDGKVHAKAEFDHVLYCQRNRHEALHGWEESALPLHAVEPIHRASREHTGAVECKKSGGLLLADEHVYRKKLTGILANEDFLV